MRVRQLNSNSPQLLKTLGPYVSKQYVLSPCGRCGNRSGLHAVPQNWGPSLGSGTLVKVPRSDRGVWHRKQSCRQGWWQQSELQQEGHLTIPRLQVRCCLGTQRSNQNTSQGSWVVICVWHISKYEKGSGNTYKWVITQRDFSLGRDMEEYNRRLSLFGSN